MYATRKNINLDLEELDKLIEDIINIALMKYQLSRKDETWKKDFIESNGGRYFYVQRKNVKY